MFSFVSVLLTIDDGIFEVKATAWAPHHDKKGAGERNVLIYQCTLDY